MQCGFIRGFCKGKLKRFFSTFTICNVFLFTDIEFVENVSYSNITRTFTLDSTELCDETIEEPVIVMPALHDCFGHALLDNCFSAFWIIQDLVENNYIKDNKVRIFIPEKTLGEKDRQLLIDDKSKSYIGGWKGLIELLTPYPVLFGHLLDKTYKFKQCFALPWGDPWQRTPFNCEEYYPERTVRKVDARFSDEVIHSKLMQFRTHTLDTLGIPPPKITNNLIIIDRKDFRKFDGIDPMEPLAKKNKTLEALLKKNKNWTLASIVDLAKKNTNWTFAGVHVLEDMTFKEQVELFSKARIIIFKHGSAGCHLLWTPPNAIVFEIVVKGLETPTIFGRLCQFTQANHIFFNYYDLDPTQIFDFLAEQDITPSE